MKLLIKNSFIENTLLYTLFLFIAFCIINSFGLTMPDDGWRHLAMALYPNEVESWQRLYPNTLYTTFDPWFMWHHFLRFIGSFVDKSSIHIVINSFIYSFLSLWYFLAFSKLTKIKKIYIIIFAIGLPMLNIRYYFLRPDILSGLFVLYFLIIKNKFLLIFISIFYAPFYYVFWFFIGYLSYIQLILKDYKKFIFLIITLIFGFIFYLTYDSNGYINIMQNVLNNDILTQGYTVGESKPFILSQSFKNQLGSSFLLILLILFSLILFFVFKPKDYLLKYMILFIPLFILQYRFLHLLEPIIFVFLIHVIYSSLKIIEENSLSYFLNIIKEYINKKSYLGEITYKKMKLLFIFFIVTFFIVTFFDKQKEYKGIEEIFIENNFIKNDEFKYKKILFTSMNTSGYMSTFLNPNASYIPSCSIGWVNYNKKNKKTYFDLLINNKNIKIENFFTFLKYNNPDYLIIDTLTTSNLKFTKDEMNKNGFTFYKIINSKLIFRKIQ